MFNYPAAFLLSGVSFEALKNYFNTTAPPIDWLQLFSKLLRCFLHLRYKPLDRSACR